MVSFSVEWESVEMQFPVKMGKEERQLRIAFLEHLLETYVRISEMSQTDNEKYKDTIERIRLQLAMLYQQQLND